MASTSLLAVLLATSSNSTYTPTFPGGLIAWIVCYSNRRKEIGGYLMLYYWHLYAGALITLLMFGTSFQSYVPESFNDSQRYHLFLLSVVPSLIVYWVEVVVATLALSVRTWDMLKLLRSVNVAGLTLALVALAIDSKYFPENVAINCYTLAISSIWTAYFYISKRVRHVFRDNDWEIFVDRIYPLESPNLRNVS